MNEPLLPCRFCQAPEVELKRSFISKEFWVYCSYCFAEGPKKFSKDDAIRVWNTPPPASIQWPDKRELIEKQDLSDFGMNLDDIYSHGEEIGFVNGANFMLEACKELNAPKDEPCWHDWLRPTPHPKSTKHCTKCGAVEQPSENKESEITKIITIERAQAQIDILMEFNSTLGIDTRIEELKEKIAKLSKKEGKDG